MNVEFRERIHHSRYRSASYICYTDMPEMKARLRSGLLHICPESSGVTFAICRRSMQSTVNFFFIFIPYVSDTAIRCYYKIQRKNSWDTMKQLDVDVSPPSTCQYLYLINLLLVLEFLCKVLENYIFYMVTLTYGLELNKQHRYHLWSSPYQMW